jgi:hypothetical protein
VIKPISGWCVFSDLRWLEDGLKFKETESACRIRGRKVDARAKCQSPSPYHRWIDIVVLKLCTDEIREKKGIWKG